MVTLTKIVFMEAERNGLSRLRTDHRNIFSTFLFVTNIFENIFMLRGSWGSSVSIVSDYKLDDSEFNPRQRQRIFPLAFVSRPALVPTQPHVQWVPGVLSPGVKRGRGVVLTSHPHLVPRLRMSRSYACSHPMRLHGV
jgi:hypothetical protein